MSDFQIPGLGQAKPNETLPPLPADVLAAAASVGEADVPSEPTTDIKLKPNHANDPNVAVQQNEVTDAMNLDQPESPPSLTSALEAAIGGLNNQPNAPEQPLPQTAEVELQNGQGEHPEWEVDSSPYESSSDSSSSDSSDEDSDIEGYEPLGVEETARLLMEAEGGSDDEGDRGKGSSAAQLRTKNEIAEEIIPKPDVNLTEDTKIEELGSIENIVDNIMLIKAITTGEYQVLDTGSVLCTAERKVIGAVAETIGKVLQPLYTVYFTSAEEIKELGLESGTKVFYPVEHASYVFTEPLKNLKGSDASNLHDEEVGVDEMEFSDDEKEAEYKRSLKQKKKDKWKNKNEPKTGGASNSNGTHPLSQEMSIDGGLNYDDDDGPYKPLTRPPGFGSGPVSTELYDPAARSGFRRGGRGGGGGDARGRGRGNRGRGSGRGGNRGAYAEPSRDGYSLPPQANQSYPPHVSQPYMPQATPPPTMPNFGFQFPGWPQPQAGQIHGQNDLPPPPPPPGWLNFSQGQDGTPNNAAATAFMSALMSQMQQQNRPAWGGQSQHSPGGQGQGQ
ncbi:hypothetical protein QQS21_003787 [Conoideocrella luteorostrata]|uniref:H/ACA ribonucleoprotein complex non-core subunit NAF1 n=1 Tax=Conoideocrella luteorostrata TaxID=1105319 RepID=A0AAJ0CVP9_9HYPO|nr:hypothetical protein QQS21_003787 [Conoideocrella luteorostrata]